MKEILLSVLTLFLIWRLAIIVNRISAQIILIINSGSFKIVDMMETKKPKRLFITVSIAFILRLLIAFGYICLVSWFLNLFDLPLRIWLIIVIGVIVILLNSDVSYLNTRKSGPFNRRPIDIMLENLNPMINIFEIIGGILGIIIGGISV